MPFDIPYRLETEEDIMRARQENLLQLEDEYLSMLVFQRRNPLTRPRALRLARPVVKDFFQVREEKQREIRLEIIEQAGLHLGKGFHRVESALPGIVDAARSRDFLAVLDAFPEAVRAACWRNCDQGTQTGRLGAVLASQKMVRDEALAIARTGRTRHMTREDLRRLIAARALFEPKNEDILTGLQEARGARPDAAALYQQCCSELLFCRIPSLLSLLARLDPRHMRRKFLARIAKLGLAPREKMALYAYVPQDLPENETFSAMEKAAAFSRKVLGAEKADPIDDCIIGLKHQAGAITGLYDHLFLSPELRQLRKLHQPGAVKPGQSFCAGEAFRSPAHRAALAFHPTKDYLDLCKARFAGDCTGENLSGDQLLCRDFLNIRIFQRTEWIGCIYVLDLTEEHGALLVDRIQIRRQFDGLYLDFFSRLKEVFQEMFSSVEYREILLPLTISNHNEIQKAWNRHRKTLRKSAKKITAPAGEMYFESLQGWRRSKVFYVLE